MSNLSKGITFRKENIGITTTISGSESFHYTIYRLGLARQADVHQQLAEGDVEGIACKIESIYI